MWFSSLYLHQVRTTHTNIGYHLHSLNPTCFEQSSSLSVLYCLQKRSEPPTTKIVFRTCSVNTYGTCFVFDANQDYLSTFVGAFAKLRNTTVSFVAFVRPSVRVLWAWNNAAPTVRVLTKFYFWGFFFWKFVEKIQISFKSDRNNGHVTWRPTYIYDNIFLNCSLSGTCFTQKL